MFIQANTNGRLHPADEPSLSPLDRGFLYGDAIYEVWRTYEGVLFAWEEHGERLRKSAAALYFDLPFTPAQIFGEIRRTTAAFRQASASPANYTSGCRFLGAADRSASTSHWRTARVSSCWCSRARSSRRRSYGRACAFRSRRECGATPPPR